MSRIVRARGHWHDRAAVLGSFTRRVAIWAFSTRPDTELVVQAPVEAAIALGAGR